ncbi:MAG: HNH endonuclease, partial [Phycisphaerales bacterium]
MPTMPPVHKSRGEQALALARRQDVKAYDRGRKGERSFYWSDRWRRLRAMVLREEPLCRMCGGPANEVDHIVPRSEDASLELVRDNLRALCKSCHSKRTGMDRGRRQPGEGR